MFTRAPDEWHELFGDPLRASAGLDRLAHSATVLTITGRSYRHGRRRRGDRRRAAARADHDDDQAQEGKGGGVASSLTAALPA